MSLLEDGIPDWARTLATLALGAGGAKVLAVWLENRRLTRREYRETLLAQIEQQLARVEDLESCVAGLQTRVGSLRVEVAHLQERLRVEETAVERLRRENDELRARLQDALEARGDPDPLA